MLTVGENAAGRNRSYRVARWWLVGIGLVVAVVIAVLAFNDMRARMPGEILPPASVPPVVALCSQPVSPSVDGTVSPLFCENGALNKQAWISLAADGTEVMRVGRDATPAAVLLAIRDDLRDRESGARECSAALLAAAYYGWSFHVAPVDGLPIDCPILN
jgi:hypothetical protein